MNFKMCAFFTGYSGYIGGLAHRPHSEAVGHTASLRSFAFPFYLVITVSFFFFFSGKDVFISANVPACLHIYEVCTGKYCINSHWSWFLKKKMLKIC